MRRGQELEEADVWEGEPAGHAAPGSHAGLAAEAADGARGPTLSISGGAGPLPAAGQRCCRCGALWQWCDAPATQRRRARRAPASRAGAGADVRVGASTSESSSDSDYDGELPAAARRQASRAGGAARDGAGGLGRAGTAPAAAIGIARTGSGGSLRSGGYGSAHGGGDAARVSANLMARARRLAAVRGAGPGCSRRLQRRLVVPGKALRPAPAALLSRLAQCFLFELLNSDTARRSCSHLRAAAAWHAFTLLRRACLAGAAPCASPASSTLHYDG